MAFARALRNGIVAFVVAYLVASRVGGDRSRARRLASTTCTAVFLVTLLRSRGPSDRDDDSGGGSGDNGGSSSGGRKVPATA